ncbi:orphan G-protein coupled receptor 14 [Plakobranchus ocellatus]|uniref:Orphan G-protein coupled receptor 14 n=1 Tax=Plakobranchus ocellatus TaxID=259542 RepID=A0AAV3Z2U2_9GAST|nr:orphan G-protein coupled receptor 14 [Plakobranchus ocellatus]
MYSSASAVKDFARESISFLFPCNNSTYFDNDETLPIKNKTFQNAQSTLASETDPQNKTFLSSFGNSFAEISSPTLGSPPVTEPPTQVNERENRTISQRSRKYNEAFSVSRSGLENSSFCEDNNNVSSEAGFLDKNSSQRNIFPIQFNRNESKLFFTSNSTTEIPSNSTNKGEKIRIWDQGLLKRHVLNAILAYTRKAITVPVGLSLIAVGLTVAVFKDKNFNYHGKPMVISFNIFEGLKCIAYLLFRMMKLHTGEARITWNSTYAQFFVYYVLWLPEALGRIGILHNGLITLDRFFTIAFPIRRLNKRLVTRPKTCVAVIVVSMFLYQSAPLIMFFSYVEPRLDYEKTFSNDEIISEIYVTNPAAFRNYWIVLIVGHACFTYIPLISAIVLNILTIVSLWRHEKARAALSEKLPCPPSGALARNNSAKRQTNKMIVGSSLVFAILVLFRRLLPVFSLFIPDFGEGRREMHVYILCSELFHLIDCVSPLANIISYTILSSQFQRRLKQIAIPSACMSKNQDGSNH